MNINTFFEDYEFILAEDFLRYFLAASICYLFFWVIFKKQWEHRIIQQKAMQAKKMWFEFRYSMSTVLIFSMIGITIHNLNKAGYTMLYNDVAEYG